MDRHPRGWPDSNKLEQLNGNTARYIRSGCARRWEKPLPNTLGDRIRAAGKTIVAAHEEQLGAVLAAQLQPIIAPPYRIETGTIADSEGRRGGPFAALICKGGQPIAAVGADAVIPIESVAVVFDVTHTLDLNSLATA